MEAPKSYRRSLADLEAEARVPLEDQISEQAEPPPPDALDPEDLDRLRLLGVTGAGRLKHR